MSPIQGIQTVTLLSPPGVIDTFTPGDSKTYSTFSTTMTWQNVKDNGCVAITNYLIMKYDSGTTFTQISSVPSNVLTYTDVNILLKID